MIRKMAASSLRFIGEVYSIFLFKSFAFFTARAENYFSQVFKNENCELINNYFIFSFIKKISE